MVMALKLLPWSTCARMHIFLIFFVFFCNEEMSFNAVCLMLCFYIENVIYFNFMPYLILFSLLHDGATCLVRQRTTLYRGRINAISWLLLKVKELKLRQKAFDKTHKRTRW